MVRELIVVKKFRSDPIPDKPIQFPALHNLYLELMENKQKLKPGLPAIIHKPIKKQIIKTPNPPKKEQKVEENLEELEIDTNVVSKEVPKKKPEKTKDEIPPEKKEKKSKEKIEKIEKDENIEEIEENITEEKDENIEELTDEVPQEENQTTQEEVPQEENEVNPEEEDPNANLSPEEIEANEKEEYIWRFKILKKKYKERDIPSYNEHDDLSNMKRTYESTLRDIKLDKSVESYKTYLFGGFMGLEFLATTYLNIDFTGFTERQQANMDKYEEMLIELGEKSNNRWNINLPVEIKLIGFIVLQAGIFYIGKILSEKAGVDVEEYFLKFANQKKSEKEEVKVEEVFDEEEEKPAKKMRGPSIKVQKKD